MKIPSFVKKYDIRGVYGIDIKGIDGFYISLALIAAFSPKKILIGWDTRPCSYELAMHTIAAFHKKDIFVAIMPECPIEYITVGANAAHYDLAIMVTGSHNPYNWTGLLIHLRGGESLQNEKMDRMLSCYQNCLHESFDDSIIPLDTLQNATTEIESYYIHQLIHLIPLQDIPAIEIAVDIGDGSGYRGLDIFESLLPQVVVHRLNDRRIYDEKTPHIADPSIPAALQQLQDYMRLNPTIRYGFAFDSDADRVLAIDMQGRYCSGSELGSLLAQVQLLLHDRNHFRIGYAVECGPEIVNTFKVLNNKHVGIAPIPVGRSIQRGLLENDLEDFCLENTGHFYYKDFFNTDSSIYSMMLLLLSQAVRFRNDIVDSSDGFRSEIHIADSPNFELIREAIIQEVEGIFSHMKLISVDGIRAEIYDEKGIMHSWFTLRKSGYEPIYKCYFGSTQINYFYDLKSIFEQYLPSATHV